MSLLIPPGVNYPSPLVAIGARWAQPPVEGAKFIACEIDWGVMGGAQKCVNFNLQNNTTLAFSQIVALKYDNSACGSDVQFIFPDSGDTITAPAYQQAITPVFTNGQQFFVRAMNSEVEDVTRFSVHNAMPPPVDLSRSELSETLTVPQLEIPTLVLAPITESILPSDVSGTMQYMSIQFSGVMGGGADILVTVEDGLGATLGSFVLKDIPPPSNPVFSLPVSAIRFNQGLNLVFTGAGGAAAGSYLAVTLIYRVP